MSIFYFMFYNMFFRIIYFTIFVAQSKHNDMKKLLTIFFAVFFITIGTSAQKQARYGTIKGSVLYDSGYGYKADAGATIYAVKQNSIKGDFEQKSDSILRGYYSLYKYAEIKGTYGSDRAVDKLKEYGFWIEPSETVRREGEFLLTLFEVLDTPAIKKELIVGANGEYSMKLPYGSYYLIFRSGNKRVSDSLLSRNGVYQVIKVKINKSITDLSCKFKEDFY